ncbi:hypothetical protein V3C99_019087 [Haemonchus contortus]
MNQKEFDSLNGFTRPMPKGIKEFRRKSSRYLQRQLCTREGLTSILYNRIPVIRWIQGYKQENLLPDIAAGVTLAIYNVPQSMAYSVLATLPPVFGLYASFFPPLFYFFFGTSYHISIGVFSLTCIMTGQARLSVLPMSGNGTSPAMYHGANLTPIDVVVLLAFLVGVIQLIMWVLHLSFLSTYLTDSAVTGLTFGAAVHAMSAQIKGLLGVHPRHTDEGFLQLIKKWFAIGEAVPHTNLVTLTISIITIVFLVLYKKYAEPQLKRKRITLPAELVALVVLTAISAIANFHGRFGVEIVGEVPIGLPPPRVPLFEGVLIKKLIVPAISIAVVAYAVTVSMGKLFARKHKYRIDPDQEIFALGISGTISSFFSVFPTSTSLSRSLVNEGAGARTQVSGLVASCVILCVILLIAPLLNSLPMCVLNSIVVVALSSLLTKVTELRYLWRFSKPDVIVWVSTALVTIFWDIIEGLATGMVLALITVVVHTQRPNVSLLGEVVRSDFRGIYNYTRAKRTETPILRFDAPVIFTNVQVLKEYIRKTLKLEPDSNEKKNDESMAMGPNWKAIILDCRAWTYTDAMGVEAMKELNDELRSKQVFLILANMKSCLRLQYAYAGLYRTFHDNQFCPTITDALTIAARVRANSEAFFKADKDDLVGVK